jgi:hypothetical protein
MSRGLSNELAPSQLANRFGVTVGASGNVYVAGTLSHNLHRIDLAFLVPVLGAAARVTAKLLLLGFGVVHFVGSRSQGGPSSIFER